MRRRRLFPQLFVSYLLVTLIPLLAVTLYGSGALRDFYYQRTADALKDRARLLTTQMTGLLDSGLLDSGRMEQVDVVCKELGRLSSSKTRITVVLPSGVVVGDSKGTIDDMGNHKGRAEIADALAGRVRPLVHTSPTLKQKMMYVAVPLTRSGETIGVLRTSVAVTDIDRALSAIRWKTLLAGAVVAAAAVGLGLWTSRRISQPLVQLKRGAERFAQGDLSQKLSVGDSEEIASLAETLNRMAAELDRRIRTAVGERNQRQAILSSMVEGVLAVDSEQYLIGVNQAAARLLGVDAEAVDGRRLQEVVRNARLEQLVTQVLTDNEPAEDELILKEGAEQRLLRANATILHDVGPGHASGPRAGALVVLHDVTRLRKLERIRSDFVANVSHELKTPITSIKGFVETLLDGAMHQPEDTERFLRIVAAQSDRLNEIIEDLLTLSRLEQDTQRAGISLQRGRIRDVLEAAVGVCELKASEKNVAVKLTCDAELRAEINAAMLEQAVVNLISNAVKYSPEGAAVLLEATADLSELVIRVRDHGCGIGLEHLPRLFERFYRVDKARSRKLGGTGLGLAIVKHIAQAHGGSATVESTPDEGSVFSLHLPW
ncbi:MAG: PAS domain-containing protein [Candidatus Nealsonbacteria bacterium]|nr:PAS domain-containing protein [Candidatus Nealsonbacteria bacterium]